MIHKETGYEDVDWINLAQYRAQWQLVKTVTDFRVP
jgi:hypothetical protein